MGMPQAPPWNPTLFNNTMYTVHCTLIAACIAHMYCNHCPVYNVHCTVDYNMNRTGLHAGETAWPNAGLGLVEFEVLLSYDPWTPGG